MQNLERIQSAIAAADLEALLLIDPKNRYYACGFPSSDGMVLVTAEKAYVIIDGRYIEACRAAIGDSAEVLLCDQAHPARKLLKQILDEHNITALGAEDGCLTHQQFTLYEKVLERELKSAQGIINRLRSQKQPHELEYMRAAQDITDAAFAEVLKHIRPGVTEREIAAELVYQMLLRGANGVGYKNYPADFRYDKDPILFMGKNLLLLKFMRNLKKISNFDVVLVISFRPLGFNYFYNRFIFNYLFNNNEKVFISGAAEKMQIPIIPSIRSSLRMYLTSSEMIEASVSGYMMLWTVM